MLREQRTKLLAALRALPKVTVWNSEANMILVRVPDADRTFDEMKAQGVLVKNVSRMHPLLAGCLRLTVGAPQENARLLAVLQTSV